MTLIMQFSFIIRTITETILLQSVLERRIILGMMSYWELHIICMRVAHSCVITRDSQRVTDGLRVGKTNESQK